MTKRKTIEIGSRVFTYLTKGESFDRLYGTVIADRGDSHKMQWSVMLDNTKRLRNVDVWFATDELRVQPPK